MRCRPLAVVACTLVALTIGTAALADEPAPDAPKPCTPQSADKPGWCLRQAAEPPTTDVTADFQTMYAAAHAGNDRKADRVRLPADADQFTYLLVKGLFGNHLPGYFHPARKRLRHLGLKAKIVKVDTDDSIAVNASTIHDAVLKQYAKKGHQVVLFGHSKGGVDALAAVALYPDLADKVRVVIAMQSPYGGSPIADDMEGCPETRQLVRTVVKGVLRGSPDAVIDLTYAKREAFVAAHPLPPAVPVLSIATSRAPTLGQMLQPTMTYMLKHYDLASDGLVVPDDAVVPGSRVVRLTDMSHPESVLRGPAGHYAAGAVAEAAVELALQPTATSAAP